MTASLQLFLLAAYRAAFSISRPGGAMPEEPEPDDQRSPDYCWTHDQIETTEEDR